ncbi:MAG: hypothetical protein H0W23_08650 [Chloroflexia bacterium]|nr:hypothetical protein [Chloroflexia bacterium]
MDSLIGGLFGGNDDDDDRKSKAQDFISRYDQGPVDEGYDDDEAFQHFQQVSQHADPDTMNRAAEQAFSRMDPDQRTQFAQYLQQQGGGQLQGRMSSDPREMAGMVSQMQRQNPGGLGALFGGGNSGGGGGIGNALGGLLGGGGGGGFPGGSMGKVALGGIAAFAMKEMLGGGGNDDKKRKRSI